MATWVMTENELPAVADVQSVLRALADPARLEMVRRLATAPGGARACNDLYEGLSKSTATHHFRILVDAGVLRRVIVTGSRGHELRRAELDAALPGLLDSVVGALVAPSADSRASGDGAAAD